MKHKVVILVLVLATAVLLPACSAIGNLAGSLRGEGPMVSEDREVGDFSAIRLEGIGTVNVSEGAQTAVRVEAQENLLPYLETAVENGTLVISARESVNLVPTQGIFYYVTTPRLDQVDMAGLGEINVPRLSGDDVDVRVGGGGNITVDELAAGRLNAVLSGLGDVNIEGGSVDEQVVMLSGGGSYNAGDLESRATEVTLSGLGSATVHASETLDARLTGGGNISYYGRPQVTQEVTGLGEIKALGE